MEEALGAVWPLANLKLIESAQKDKQRLSLMTQVRERDFIWFANARVQMFQYEKLQHSVSSERLIGEAIWAING